MMKYEDGSIYEGDWKNDQRSGQGELKDSSEKTINKGKWENDQFVKEACYFKHDNLVC